MSLLDKASLIVTPNSYKESKLYSVVPNTTLGDMDVVRATTATRVNSAGLIENVGVNIPRIDYTNGSCPSLLVEGQRTNLNLYSEQFDNAYWTKSRVSISANTSATTDPSGNNNADLVTQDAVDTNGGTVFRSLTFTAAAHTFIVFAKMNEVRYINLAENVSSGSTRRTWFDLQSGVIGTTSAGHTAKIENYGNGWYRCSITFTALAIANSVFVYLSNADGSTAAVVSKGSYFYGAQLEAGSYPTSYIPTVASTVTRNADVISKTGISSLIGTEFTMFFDGFESMGGASSRYLILKGASTTYNNYISIEGLSGNRIGFYIYNNVGALVFAASSGAFTNGQRIKLAARCKN